MAQTRTRTFPDGDYAQRLNQLWAAMEQAAKEERDGKTAPLLGGESPASEMLAEEYRNLKDEADADAAEKRRVVTLQALDRQTWRALKRTHPPRVGDDVDPDVVKGDRLAGGINTESVEDDLVYAAVIEPKFQSRAAFDEWVNTFSEGEFQVLVTDAWEMVNRAHFDPKSLPASRSPRNGTS